MATKTADGGNPEQVQLRMGEDLRERVNVVAYECGGPGSRVARSEVIRAAFRDYYRKHRSSLEVCNPRDRGAAGPKPRKQVSVKFLPDELQRVEQVAYDCGGPEQSVSRSDVLRAAVRDYADKHEGDLRECEPSVDGVLSGGGR